MIKNQKKTIVELRKFYESKQQEYKEHFEAFGWESKEAQLERFSILLNSVDLQNRTLLDVGCGYGDLYQYLCDQGIKKFTYTGVELTKPVVDKASSLHPGADFILGDILHDDSVLNSSKFDVIYGSGLFSLKVEDNYSYLHSCIAHFLNHASEYIVFNLLSEKSIDKEDTFFYYSPEEVSSSLNSYKFENITIVEDYLINDFTVVCKVN